MGANAEGKISLSVELQNFKDIANNLKKGLTQELKQIPLDVKFNNKELEAQVAASLREINKMLSETKFKNLDFSSLLPAFINEINKGDISDEIRAQVVEGLKAGLTNLKEGGLKNNYAKIKGFSGNDLLNYFLDANSVEDILGSFRGLSKRQRQGLRTSVLPSFSELKGRGWDAADKEYIKGAKRLEALMNLSGEYGDVLQYGTNPTATKDIIKELYERLKKGIISKNDAKDIIGYLTRSEFLGIDLEKELKDFDVDPTELMDEAKLTLGNSADKISTALKERAKAFFTAYDNIFNSTAKKITYTELLDNVENTTNKRFQGLYNTNPSNELKKIDVGKLFKESVKVKSEDKPEFRKRKRKEDVIDTTKTKPHSEEELRDFEFDNEEEIQDYNAEIQRLDNEYNKLDEKLDELSDKATRLRKEIPEEEKTLNDLNTQIDNKQAGIETRKNRDNKRLNDLNKRKEGLENQNKDIDATLEKLQKRKEELVNKITTLRKEEYDLYHIPEEQEDQWYTKTAEESYIEDVKKDKLIPEQLNLKADEEALNRTYEAITSKRELQKLLKEKLEEIKSINKEIDNLYNQTKDETLDISERNKASLLMQDKTDVRSRLNLDYSRIYRQAVKQGVNEKTLNKYYNEGLELPDLSIARPTSPWSSSSHDGAEQDNLDLVKEQVERRKERIQKIKDEIEEEEKKLAEIIQKLNGFDLDKIKERRNKIPEEQKAIEKEIEKTNEEIYDQEFAKKRNNSLLKGTQIDIDELQSEQTQGSENSEQELQELKKQRDNQKKIYDEKKQINDDILNQMDEVEQQMNKIQDKRNELIQKQEELNRQEEQRRKEEAERTVQEAKEDNKKKENNTKKQAEETKSEKDTASTFDASISSSIPPEKLQEILTLLGNIQKALGTLDDSSDIPSITQSVKDMADALKELSTALGEIKQKDFNLNIGLPNNNPIGQQGEAKRRILKELEKQYNELDSYFINKYGDDSSAFNALSKLEGGSNYVKTMMSDFSIVGDINAPLTDKINVYKNLIEQLRSFVIQEGGDLNKIVSNTLSPDKIIEQINQDISNTNPVTAISKIFEDIKVSIDASMAQINTESKGFSFLSGSAEEAAEAKKKFVEANKDVLQSIVASMPKIEQEAKALEKVEDIKEENNKTSEDFIEDKTNIEKEKKQVEEIVKRRKEAQQQYENQFHTWGEDGQLSFLDKNDYDLQNEYLELQKQEVEQLAKQAEQNPPKVNIPIEGQISFTNEEDINKIANEVYENSFIVNKDGQYSLFRNVEAASNWGQELKEDLQEASKTDFSNLKNQLSLKDWEIAIDKRDKGIEERFKKINNSKSFIQNKDLPNEFLKQYEDISTRNGEGYKATSNLRELKNLGDELANIKTKLKVSFDEAGNLKSFADPLEIQSLLERYDELTQKIQRLKLLIESPDSQEFKLLKDTKEAEVEVEKLTSTLEKAYAKLSSSEKITTDTEKLLNPFAEANIPMTESIEQMIDSIGRMRDIHSELASSFDSEGKLIGDPKRVQSLITEYNNLSKVVDELKVKISSPTSEENITLNLAKDAEKAEKELDKLKGKVQEFFDADTSNLFNAQTRKVINSYGAKDASKQFISSDKLDGQFGHQQKQVENLIALLKEYGNAVEELRQVSNKDNIGLDELEDANKKVEDLEKRIKTLSQTIKTSGIANATSQQTEKLTSKIEGFLEKNPNLPFDTTKKLKEYLEVLKSGATISKTAYDSMSADVTKFMSTQGGATSVWDLMTMKIKEGVAFLATKFSFYEVFNQFRQGYEVIHQFDDALTEMMKVSEETRDSLEAYQKTTFDTAEAIGTSALQLQNSTADFMRLGEALNEASESAKTANVLMNVSEFQSIDEATTSLIAMGAAYDDLSKMQIVDKLNEVGNNYSISTSGAAEALQMSASALKTAGNDMDEALALVTAGNQVVQDISKAGNGLRTIALRLTGTKSAKEELEEMGEETENVITTQSKLRDTIKEATAVASNGFKGFDILDDNGNYKSTYEIMLGIAQIYQEIVDTDKQLGRNNANLLLETVAGIRE